MSESEYKAPATRIAIKTKARTMLMDWVEENLDESGDTMTVWDDADDAAARAYQDSIECDRSHSQRIKEAKERFWEELRMGLESEIMGVFEELGK